MPLSEALWAQEISVSGLLSSLEQDRGCISSKPQPLAQNLSQTLLGSMQGTGSSHVEEWLALGTRRHHRPSGHLEFLRFALLTAADRLSLSQFTGWIS